MRGIEEYTNMAGISSTKGLEVLLLLCGRDAVARSSRGGAVFTGSMEDILMDLRWRDPGLLGAPAPLFIELAAEDVVLESAPSWSEPSPTASLELCGLSCCA